MELTTRILMLISMILTGLVYGLIFHHVVMPEFGSELIHCMVSGGIFGGINYFIVFSIYKAYSSLKSANREINKELRIDNLTGLLNRRAFESDTKENSSAKVYSALFIDIDNFKDFNDKYGHPKGDEILRRVSQTIKSSVRLEDKVYRYGGEEIIVILRNCDKTSAQKVAEKIRTNIYQLDNSPYSQVTISIGVSSFPDDGSDLSKIISVSDRALLEAKRQGKNRTVVF